MNLKEEIQKHLESAITHGYNDAQVDNDGLGEVCRMEAQQNLRNAMADIKKWALEMVQPGEIFLDQEKENEDYWMEENDQRGIRNKTKEEIRQRIEEATK